MPVGYSGTPLLKKLGIGPGTQLAVLGKPKEYESLLGELPPDSVIQSEPNTDTTLVHAFVTERLDLESLLKQLLEELADTVPVWISWPKKSSKVPTTITENVIRDVALPLGFVDIKVCAVSEVWSALKLVVRKELRGTIVAKPNVNAKRKKQA
ncbi:MAG: hypothetical protein R3B84_14305 [Zavarzinella sp.]